MSFNGTIIITFTEGLASLVINEPASRIPVGILDRWMRTKGVRLFRAQQQVHDKRRVAITNGETPVEIAPFPKMVLPSVEKKAVIPTGSNTPAPVRSETGKVSRTVAEALAAATVKGVKDLHQKSIVSKTTALPPSETMHQKVGMPRPIVEPQFDKTNEQAVEQKVTDAFVQGHKQPEAPHPEMDKIEAAIARAERERIGEDQAGDSVIEEK